MGAGGPGFYGPEYAPFVIESDPVQPDFEVLDLKSPEGIAGRRAASRQRLLAGIENLQRKQEQRGRAQVMSTYYAPPPV